MSDQPLLDGAYENLVGDFLRWQRRAKIAAIVAVVAGLALVAVGAFIGLRAENTRTTIQSPSGVPCANPHSARCLREAAGISRAIDFVQACRFLEAARFDAPSCVVASPGPALGARGTHPREERGQRDAPSAATDDPSATAGGGSETGGPPSGQPSPPAGGSPGDGGDGGSPGAGASPTGPGPTPQPPPPEPEHGGIADDVDEAVDQVTDTACDTAGGLGVNPPGVCR